MLMTLVGTLFGGAFRMLPEVIKMFDRKAERAHELAMFDRQLKADTLKGRQAIDKAHVQVDGAIGLAEIQAIIEATKAQAVQTGIKWVDAISALMRPIITFWWVIVMYTGALVTQYAVLIGSGIAKLEAVLTVWGPDEKAIAASIISFWFVDRSLRKN